MKRKNLSLDDYFNGIKSGDISILSRAITLVESHKNEHKELANNLLKKIIPLTGKSKRIGISGTPGVGKSTFIENFGKMLTAQGLKVAVLAIDPTSYKTGGSILGDKTRMYELSSDKSAFIRPSPSGNSLGGVASKTRESLLLCEASGFDIIIVETVGVGQSEIAVSKIVDFFLLLMQPGGGDDLQGIKRGILELADLVAINKSDGELLIQAKVAQREYETAVHILRQNELWTPKVISCSSITGMGLEDIWKNILEYYTLMKKDNQLTLKREEQIAKWFHELIFEKLQSDLNSNLEYSKLIKESYEEVIAHKISLIDAVDKLYKKILR